MKGYTQITAPRVTRDGKPLGMARLVRNRDDIAAQKAIEGSMEQRDDAQPTETEA